MGNAEIILLDEGAYVYSGYNYSEYDLEPAYAVALIELTEYVSVVVMTKTLAGYTIMKRFAQKRKDKIQFKKPATIFHEQYFDWGRVTAHGNLCLDLSNYYIVTEEDTPSYGREAGGCLVSGTEQPLLMVTINESDKQDATASEQIPLSVNREFIYTRDLCEQAI